MRVKTSILVIIGLALTAWSSGARASDAVDFQVKGISARPTAMGQAFVAVTGRADSIFWNPAALAINDVTNIGTVHSSLNDFDMNTDMLSLAGPVGKKTGLGLSFFRSSIGNIEEVIRNPVTSRAQVRGYFDETETAVAGGVGYAATDKLFLGATLKYMGMKFLYYSESGIGLDLGLLYKATENFNFGINLQNVAPVKFGVDKIPFNAKVGFALKTDDDRLIFAADLDSDVLNDTVYHVGAEYWIVPQLAVRLGANDGDMTAGVGLANINSNWHFDYAYNDSEIGDTHRVSVNFDFEKSKRRQKTEKADVAKPAPKPEPVAEQPVVGEAPKAAVQPPIAPAVAIKLISTSVFLEQSGLVTISSTDLKADQAITVYMTGAKVADVKITSVGMLSSKGKITKQYADILSSYKIGNGIVINE